MNDKPFDCVDMMHRGQAEILKKLADLSDDEQVRYWRDKTAKLRQRQERLRSGNTAAKA